MGSQYEAIRGMSYSQISDIIDSLANQLPAPVPPRVPSPPPQSPQINFFADGGLGEETTEAGTYQVFCFRFSLTSTRNPTQASQPQPHFHFLLRLSSMTNGMNNPHLLLFPLQLSLPMLWGEEST